MNVLFRFLMVVFGMVMIVTQSYAADAVVSVEVTGTLDVYNIVQTIQIAKTGVWSNIFEKFKSQAGLDQDLQVLVVKSKEFNTRKQVANVLFYAPVDAYDMTHLPNNKLKIFLHPKKIDQRMQLLMANWCQK